MATPLIMYRGNRKAADKRNIKRAERYTVMVDAVETGVTAAKKQIRAALELSHPAPTQLSDWIAGGRLWERRLTDEDFLDVAVGVADVPSGLTVEIGKTAALEADPMIDLQDRAEAVKAAAATVRDAPFTVSLQEHAVIGVEGPRAAAAGLARSMLLEAVVCCGPDELSLLVAAPPDLAHEWAWATGIPHMARGAEAAPAIATDAKALATALARVVEPRAQLLDETDWSTAKAGLAHLIIVLDAYHPLSELQEIPLLQDALARARQLGITVLTVSETPRDSPAEASTVLVVDGRGHGVLQPVRSSDLPVRFAAIGSAVAEAQRVASVIGRRQLVSDLSFVGDSSGDLLLDLLDQRPLRPRWDHRDPSGFLTATFGVQADGRPFTLDLKEGAANGHGPHGLLVGATGSGKSELLRSMITSLALTHSPDELQMSFVDFKGGAAFELLAELPHCTGLITNILDDLTLIDRMRSSLTGELLARQRLLAGAGQDLQGIRDYWALREQNPDLPRLPYLLLVIDEFAELLEAEPKFLDLLLSIGRQGRSLGVHLLLASQRLEAGRIRGLESYLSYRIALRTFTAEESSAAIGSKAAAELPPLPGHGFFRAAATLQRFKGSQISVTAEGPQTDLALVVERLRTVPQAPPLWLAPLPNSARMEFLALEDPRLEPGAVPVEEGLPFPVGLLDDPLRRRQNPVLVDVARLGGHLAIVGAPQSGKSSAMATELLQAARRYPAYLLRFHVLDFGGGLLAATANLPNVGSYATPQEPHRVARILAEMVTLLDERAVQFRRDRVSSMTEQRRLAERVGDEETQAHTVLVIDNYAAFKERYAEFEPVIERLLIEGANFGLHLHLSTARWTDVNARKLEQIAARFELRLNEASDSQFGRAKGGLLSGAGPGRALGPGGMQMQIAAPYAGSTSSVPGALGDVVAGVAAGSGAPKARRLLLLDDLSADEFRQAERAVTGDGDILLGLNESGFRPVPFAPGRDGHLMIFGDVESGRTSTLSRMIAGAARTGVDTYVVDFRGGLLRNLDVEVRGSATSLGELEAMVGEVKELFDGRMTAGPAAGDRPVLVVVDDFELVQALSPMGRPGTLLDLSAYALVSERVAASFVLNQIATNAAIRAGDLLVKRTLESAPWRMHFSIAARTEMLPGNLRGRPLAPGVAQLIRSGRPEALIRTLSPAAPRQPE
ncbi:S-DNA-T family DNA segregation ATPase FtsK/SpoIIIE [Actinoplanes abujensis]|uniref:S-DNA-T family DNA segregation ATPase FtsK/SpoIIIE n=2 Tax=Paractinoplanes abujensis TaxID=882441 RepID=A0A7W7CTB6_9ACTN|nr:S-DNA-T family DNA segregation ATPase FtsK/SpoIIIE [Actinoplanes abujensis]